MSQTLPTANAPNEAGAVESPTLILGRAVSQARMATLDFLDASMVITGKMPRYADRKMSDYFRDAMQAQHRVRGARTRIRELVGAGAASSIVPPEGSSPEQWLIALLNTLDEITSFKCEEHFFDFGIFAELSDVPGVTSVKGFIEKMAARLLGAERHLCNAIRVELATKENSHVVVARTEARPLSDNEEAADVAIRSGCGTLKEISKMTDIGVETLKNHVIPALKRKRGLLSKPYRYE